MSTFAYQITFSVLSVQELGRLAQVLSADLQPGDVLALDGPLGAGKTTFCQQLGFALGVQEPIASPTFVLVHEYLSGRMPLIHADLYRLGEAQANSMSDELAAIADEGRAIVVVEWACYGRFMEDLTTIAIDLAYVAAQPNARSVRIQSNRKLPGLSSFRSDPA